MTDETKPQTEAGPPKQAGPANDAMSGEMSAQTPAEVRRGRDGAASRSDDTSGGTAEASPTAPADNSDATVEIPASELPAAVGATDSVTGRGAGSAVPAGGGDETVEIPAADVQAAVQGGHATQRADAAGEERDEPGVAGEPAVVGEPVVVGEPETAGDAPEPAAAGATASASRSPWRRFAGAVFTTRLTAANAIIALLVGLLGFALITQVRSNSNESTLSNDRPDDLVRILSDLDARKDRLSTEISSLQGTVAQLNSGAQGRQAALDALARRADELGILGGTLAAQGPGLVVELVPAAKQQVPANTVLDTVEELRGAGAEAMEISGTGSSAVRIIASTYFTDASGGVKVDGTTMGGTLSITVIGDPQTMQAALSIAGGVVDTVHNDGGAVDIQTPGSVSVTALHQAEALRYAKPAS
jgi:uncharacterized protein YlxW (UPF0749 family)